LRRRIADGPGSPELAESSRQAVDRSAPPP